MNETIFVVDDCDDFLQTAERDLCTYYNVITVESAAKMFEMLEHTKPALILMEIAMSGMGGLDALDRLRKQEENIPVILLTEHGQEDDKIESRGFKLGAVDFMTKPLSIQRLINRIEVHVGMDRMIQKRAENLKRTSLELESVHRNMLFVLADIVESRDGNTGGHIDRTVQYTEALIKAMIKQNVYADELSDWNLSHILACAALHDIGKISISDTILNKPGSFTDEERDIMKSHTSIGTSIISRVGSRIGNSRFLDDASLFTEFHHENWDGSGYPRGLQGKNIPLQGRIMAIADVYDALVTVRPYKKAFLDEVAIDIIAKDSGKKFDPAIVDVFLSITHEFATIRRKYEILAMLKKI